MDYIIPSQVIGLLDCEFSARIWRSGAAVVVTEPAVFPREASAAWRSVAPITENRWKDGAVRGGERWEDGEAG